VTEGSGRGTDRLLGGEGRGERMRGSVLRAGQRLPSGVRAIPTLVREATVVGCRAPGELPTLGLVAER